MLNLKNQPTISDLTCEAPPWNPNIVENYLAHHENGKISALLCPGRPEYSETIAVEHIEAAINCLRQSFDYVIVDTAPLFREMELAIMDLSSLIFMVTALDISSVKNTRLCLSLLKDLQYNMDDIKVILNRGYPPVAGMGIQEVQKGLDWEITSLIPSAGKEVTYAINHGVPFMLKDISSDLAKAYFRLAKLTVEETGGSLPQKNEVPLFY